MQKIIPHLWFNTEAKEAAEFYTSAFQNSKITHVSQIHNTPSGDCDIVSFDLLGFSFMAISAGPLFKFNPSISFMVNFDPSSDPDAKEHLDRLWNKLSEGGSALMPLDKYPFSERFGWIQDKYGVSWQLILTNPAGEKRPAIIPAMLFVGDVCGKTKEATDFYLSVFEHAPAKKGETKRGALSLYPAGREPDKEGSVMFTDFKLDGVWMVAMDSAHPHKFAFNEAISLIIPCDTQEEIDYFWEKLSTDPKAEQCGWLKDKYGVSWQVWPTFIGDVMNSGDQEKIDRLTKAFLSMKKYDLATLKKAVEEK